MARLTVPLGSRVYVDTAPIIYTIEENEDLAAVMEPVWKALADGDISVVTSELSLLETLVRPIRNSDAKLIDSYTELLTSGEVSLIPISISILREAAELRANQNFKTPDAIHAATALASGCDRLLANDNTFRRLQNVEVTVISDLL